MRWGTNALRTSWFFGQVGGRSEICCRDPVPGRDSLIGVGKTIPSVVSTVRLSGDDSDWYEWLAHSPDSGPATGRCEKAHVISREGADDREEKPAMGALDLIIQSFASPLTQFFGGLTSLILSIIVFREQLVRLPLHASPAPCGVALYGPYPWGGHREEHFSGRVRRAS